MESKSISNSIRDALQLLYHDGYRIRTEKWQGVSAPQDMFEILNLDLRMNLESKIEKLKIQCKPSEPWADLHFAERVGGLPTNPGETYYKWPYWRGDHLTQGEFTHTYQQRMWTPRLEGIKYNFGDLGDLVELLKREPDTRQAYLPIWFPEDTGVKHGGRVPCTIGYHFIIRNSRIYVRYYLRSCDARRHFNDDIYLANRLTLWLNEQLESKYYMGELIMNITSFHIFESDRYWLSKQVN
jgi:thymidylate synthase